MATTIEKIGLVGGVGWPATLMYYERLCKSAQAYLPGGSPRICIESLDMRETLAHRGQSDDPGSWSGFDRIFRDALALTEHAGCTVAAIASVTPHARFAEITAGATIPVVNILDAVTGAAHDQGLGSAIMLGTPVTMQSTWFHDGLRAAGIACQDDLVQGDINEIAKLLETFFYSGRGPEGRADLLAFCHRVSATKPDAAIILACTDFASAFPEFADYPVFEVEGLTFLDAGTAHVKAILTAATRPG
ncbi:aspartate/glutamate racemase family protein [Sulfitobacter sp. JB4-11]|uniref:aspartate/glutamate racemase family protein n=1 Tax=Sulfitobacter rhodophyticola TaxID=3238304 RepID=UPI0035149C76